MSNRLQTRIWSIVLVSSYMPLCDNDTPSLSLSLSHSVSLTLSLFLSLSLSHSVSLTLSLSHSLSFCLTLFRSVSLSLPNPLSVCICVCECVYVCVFVSGWECVSVCINRKNRKCVGVFCWGEGVPLSPCVYTAMLNFAPHPRFSFLSLINGSTNTTLQVIGEFFEGIANSLLCFNWVSQKSCHSPLLMNNTLETDCRLKYMWRLRVVSMLNN